MSAGARLASLRARFDLPGEAERRLALLLDVVADDPHAPTTVRTRDAAVDRHVADSLAALELDAVRAADTVADLGAGAGFPGLALAAALPHARVALIESSTRKCNFLERAAAAAEISNATVVCGRAEEWAAGIERNELVTARALAPLPVVVEYAAPLLAVGGSLIVWRGRRDAPAEAAAEAAAGVLGLAPVEVRETHPFPRARHHHLHVYLKVRPTPERFPRRPGMARKKPLRP